jgi:hypothetical protein
METRTLLACLLASVCLSHGSAETEKETKYLALP